MNGDFFSASVWTGQTPATVWSTEWVLRTSGCMVLKMTRWIRTEQRGILTSGSPSSWPGLTLFVWCVFGEQTHCDSYVWWMLIHMQYTIHMLKSYTHMLNYLTPKFKFTSWMYKEEPISPQRNALTFWSGLGDMDKTLNVIFSNPIRLQSVPDS